MPSIDERVVSMAFENAKFESGVAHTMGTLDKLNASLSNIGKMSGLQNIEAEANKVTLSGPMSAIEKLKAKLGFPESKAAFAELEASGDKVQFSGITGAIDKVKAKLGFPEAKTAFAELEAADDKVNFADAGAAVDGISSKFGAMQVAGVTAFATIVSTATAKLGELAGQVTGVQTAVEGFRDYELKIGATQTIMAGTGESIGTVSKYLKDLDIYADRTIYSLRDMTGNIGKFTNAGVKLPVAVDAMKGIANVAALSGANSNEAARAMYNLGQAIGQGTVRLMDWRSVELANMGTREFKEELIKAALATGDLKKGADGLIRTSKGNVVNSKNFTSTLQDQWLTADALTDTLRKYSDENTNLGKRAYAAATNVKTFSMMIETLAAAAGTGWTDTFEIIFGNLPQATKLWTGLTNTIGGFIGKVSESRNETLKEWREWGGRAALIDGVKGAFAALMAVLKPIGQAFRDIFPAKSGEQLAEMTHNWAMFMIGLMPSKETIDALRRIFAGFFAILSIGWTIVKQVAGVIFDLLSVAGKGSGGFLNFVASIGDFLVAADKAISKGGALAGIFKSIGAILKVPLEIIKEIAGALFGMFDGADPEKAEGVAGSMDALDKALRPLRGTLKLVKEGWEKFLDLLGKVREAVEPALTKTVDAIGNFGKQVADGFKNIDWGTALQALETGLVGGIFLKLRSILSGGAAKKLTGGMFENINGILRGLTGNLEAMQQNLQAKTLLSIAIAIGVLAAGILILSTIDPKDLSRAMSAVAIGLGQLVGALALLTKFAKGPAALMLPVIAASMIGLAIAVTILAGAMKIMATMDWEEIGKGLVGVGGAIAVVAAATQLIGGPRLLVAAAGLLPLAIALNILAVAVKIFASMSWEEMGRGLAGVAGSLLAIALAMAVMPPTMLITGAGLILVATGLTLLSGAVSAFGNMDLKAMVQGLFGIAGAIMVIGLSVGLLPPTLPLIAAGLILLSIALTGIAAVIGILGSMDVATLVKGIVAMGASLLVLAGGLYLMAGTIPGAVALLAAAAALAILAPTLAFLGSLEWGTIFKGLAAIALTLGTLAIVGALAAVPLIALGGALAVLGLGLLAVAASVYLFAKALALVGAEGTKAFAALIAAIGAFIVLFPKMVIDFVKGLVTIMQEVVKVVPEIVKALVSIVTTLLDAVIDLAPKLAEAIGVLITSLLKVLQDNHPNLIAAGFDLFLNLLRGVRDNIGQIIKLAADIVIKLITGLANNLPKIINAGVNMLIKFVGGITSQFPKIVTAVANMIAKFIHNVSLRIPLVVEVAMKLMARFINAVASNVGRVIRAGVNLVLALMDGIGDAIPRLVRKGLEVARKFLNGIADGLAGLADVGFKAIIRFLRGLEKAIRENFDDLFEAGAGVADAIIDGLIDQFGKVGHLLRRALDKVFGILPGWAKKILGISSPSKVFAEIGRQIMLGVVVGIEDGSGNVNRSMATAANNLVDTAKTTFGRVPDMLEGLIDMDPVITPVLDLSQVEKEAKGLGDLTNVVPITAAASFDQAAVISDSQKAAETAQAVQAGPTFNYEQNNYSPEALSDVEIYRQTKNQLSQVKSSLGLVS